MKPEKPAFYTVAVYLCDRAYGGPEEGGWWYDTGTRVDDLVDNNNQLIQRIFQSEDAAYEYCCNVNAHLETGINDDGCNRDLSSVCCEGRYRAMVCDGYPASHYPEVRPHYE